MAEISADILIACDDENRRGGIKRIFVINSDKITSFAAGASHEYTSVTLDGSADVFFEIQGEFETKSLNQEGSKENGSSTFTNTLEVNLPRLDKTKAATLQSLVDSCDVTAIAEVYDKTGTYNRAFVVGWDEVLFDDAGCMATVNANNGPALQDQNSYTLTLTSKSAELCREFVGTIETNLSGTVNFGS